MLVAFPCPFTVSGAGLNLEMSQRDSCLRFRYHLSWLAGFRASVPLSSLYSFQTLDDCELRSPAPRISKTLLEILVN